MLVDGCNCGNEYLWFRNRQLSFTRWGKMSSSDFHFLDRRSLLIIIKWKGSLHTGMIHQAANGNENFWVIAAVAKQMILFFAFFQRLDAALLNASLVTTETVISVKLIFQSLIHVQQEQSMAHGSWQRTTFNTKRKISFWPLILWFQSYFFSLGGTSRNSQLLPGISLYILCALLTSPLCSILIGPAGL